VKERVYLLMRLVEVAAAAAMTPQRTAETAGHIGSTSPQSLKSEFPAVCLSVDSFS